MIRVRGEDELTVIISLAVVFGMIIGALVVLWIAVGGPERIVWWQSQERTLRQEQPAHGSDASI